MFNLGIAYFCTLLTCIKTIIILTLNVGMHTVRSVDTFESYSFSILYNSFLSFTVPISRMTLATNKDPEFVEEVGLGLNLAKLPAFFDDKNKYAYLISDNCVFVFNARSGKRLYILRYNENQLIVHANDQYVSSLLMFTLI